MNDAEMHALLSGYAAGTLTEAEQRRLFEKALNHQALFDALADAESMRAALANPLVKQQLLRLLNDLEEKRQPAPAPNRWLWVGLAAALVVGTVSLTFWPKPVEEPQTVAMARPAAVQPEVEAKPQAPLPIRKTMPAAPPAPKVDVAVENIKREVAVADTAIPDAAGEKQASALAPSPRASANAFRMEVRAPGNGIEVFKGALSISPGASGYLYAFVVGSDQIRPLKVDNPVRAGTIPLGAYSSGAELWYVLTREEDDVLKRASTGVLPLPNRNWTKVKLN